MRIAQLFISAALTTLAGVKVCDFAALLNLPAELARGTNTDILAFLSQTSAVPAAEAPVAGGCAGGGAATAVSCAMAVAAPSPPAAAVAVAAAAGGGGGSSSSSSDDE